MILPRGLSLFCLILAAIESLCDNNNLKVPPSQINDRVGEKVSQYSKDLERGQKICWSQTVLVVGQEEAGKTALCHALSGHRCADHAQMTEASTVGIDTVPWSTVVAIPRTNRSNYIPLNGQCTASICPCRIALQTRDLSYHACFQPR